MSNPAPQAVWQTFRERQFQLQPGRPDGGRSYTVALDFASDWYVTAAGQQQFDVSINGTQVLTNFDIYATAGGKDKAIQETLYGHGQRQRPDRGGLQLRRRRLPAGQRHRGALRRHAGAGRSTPASWPAARSPSTPARFSQPGNAGGQQWRGSERQRPDGQPGKRDPFRQRHQPDVDRQRLRGQPG